MADVARCCQLTVGGCELLAVLSLDGPVECRQRFLDRAIQAKDANQFTAAYGQLTASCNARHKSYDRTAIVIQPTAAATFSDQDVRPPTK